MDKKERWKILDERVPPENCAELINMNLSGEISRSQMSKIFQIMLWTGKTARWICDTAGISQISDETELEKLADDVIIANPAIVEEIRSGKENAINALVGKVMKASNGSANPGRTKEILREKIVIKE